MALVALVAIVLITAAWWGLALWPAGADGPEWLLRTRAACFGAAPGGLPDAGGWVLLVGEPLGMLAVLLAVWGRSLRADLERLSARPVGRIVAVVFVLGSLVGVGALGVRTTRAYASMRATTEGALGLQTQLDADAPATELTDQHGRRVSFADYRGNSVLVTFAFGHCTTVCPTLVRDLIVARRAAARGDVRIVVVTLDPWRDTPDRLPHIVSQWGLAPDDRVLSGGTEEVQAMLDALGIGRSRNETNGDIVHVGTVLMLNERGRIAWRLDGGWSRVGELLLRRQ